MSILRLIWELPLSVVLLNLCRSLGEDFPAAAEASARTPSTNLVLTVVLLILRGNSIRWNRIGQ